MSPDAAGVQLAVIVPAYRCAATLHASLAGLLASEFPRQAWELVVVDDGSGDETAAVAARFADRVVTVSDGPLGPAHARNAGAATTRAPILVFVDADVVVAPTTLRQLAAHLRDDSGSDAVFGAYDATPADEGFVSQYRNLLHHRVHALHRGAASTFWAGCGAVRHDAFDAVGQFDALRYPRPQVEDIDLGYRLGDAGYRILLDPEITGRHLKSWTLRGMLRADLFDRAIPWMQLLRERRTVTGDGALNTGNAEKLLTGFAGLAGLTAMLALATTNAAWLLGTALALLMITIASLPLLAWYARMRGVIFAMGVIPLRWLFYGECALGAAVVLLIPLARRANMRAGATVINGQRARVERSA